MIAKLRINKTFFQIVVTLTTLVISVLPVEISKAEVSNLPDIMVGQVEVKQNLGSTTKTYYGGFTGNEIIFNRSLDTKAEFEFSKTARKGLATCIGADLRKVNSCFFFNLSPFSNAVKMFRSRTSVNGVDSIEIASLFYGSKIIMGDAYSGSNDLNNFAFWGRSLAQSKGDISRSDAPWKLSGYSLNNDSQGSWLDNQGNETAAIKAFSGKLSELFSNSTPITSETISALSKDGTNINLYLQAEGNQITTDIYQKGKDLSPEGKVWSIGQDLTVGKNKKIVYHGVGTIVIKGNLIVGEGTSFVPADEKVDHIGVIVLDE